MIESIDVWICPVCDRRFLYEPKPDHDHPANQFADICAGDVVKHTFVKAGD